jgi:hypothetical protein
MKRSLHVGTISVPYDSGHYRKRMGLGPEILFRECLEPLFLKRGINFRHEEIISNPASRSARARLTGVFPRCISAKWSSSLNVSLYAEIVQGLSDRCC